MSTVKSDLSDYALEGIFEVKIEWMFTYALRVRLLDLMQGIIVLTVLLGNGAGISCQLLRDKGRNYRQSIGIILRGEVLSS